MIRISSLLSLMWLLAGPGMAQSLSKQADRQFNQLAYAKAADLYERVLTRPAALSASERRDAQARLGYSYQQLHDTKKAEQAYRQLLTGGDLPAEYAEYYLYYAQTLVSNGKYREAQAMYAKYDEVQPDDQRGPKFSKLYREAGAALANKADYKVDVLKLNTNRVKYSPVRFRDAQGFIASGTSSRRTGPSYLNLYYLPDASATSGTKANQSSQLRVVRLTDAESTAKPVSANDSRTIGFFLGNSQNAGNAPEASRKLARQNRSSDTKGHEGPATFTADGRRVIFSRSDNVAAGRKADAGSGKLKLYTAWQSNGIWSNPEEMPFNGAGFSTGHPALSADDKLLYFASDRPGGFGGTDIYVSSWTGSGWSAPVNLGRDINSKGNELFPFVDERGNLYVASDGHEGLGKLDLFYAQLDGTGRTVQSLQNLGEPFNSTADDFGIVTDETRQHGYFSSNRQNGSTDNIYQFARAGSQFPCRELTVSIFDADTKQPLGNTSVAVDGANSKEKQLKTNAKGQTQICLDANTDIELLASRDGYVPSKVGFSTRYFEDNQPSMLEIPLGKPAGPQTATLLGYVKTQDTKRPVAGAKVLLINECDGSSDEVVTGPDGCYEFTVRLGCAYALEAVKADMGTNGARVAKDGSGLTDILMFRKGDVMTIENIYYDVNKSTLRPEAMQELDKVVDLMKKYPAMQIELRSHTDSRATTGYNATLSGNRAKAAVTYLKSKGIAPKRMVAKGYGESQLLNKCKDGVDCTEDEHRQNRRTEIKILKLG